MIRQILMALVSLFLFAQWALPVEFRVNTYATSRQLNPAVSMDSAGNFVVVWESHLQDGSGDGIYGQRYNWPGVPQGGEFRVNMRTSESQRWPSVAMDAAGDFVVGWCSNKQDGSQYGIYGQRYNSDGVRQGGEFRANVGTVADQREVDVAMNSAGDFVFVWSDNGYENPRTRGVVARPYDSAGNPKRSDLHVNTFTVEDQDHPSVAIDSQGAFVVVWESDEQDGSGSGIYGRRYNPTGGARGGEFQVNVTTSGSQTWPSVATDPDGDFVVAWGSSSDVYARRYDSSGLALGGEFLVNDYTTGYQGAPSVAVDSDGDFLIAWLSRDQDGSEDGVYARRFDALGDALGDEFLVNTHTANDQYEPSAAIDSAGNAVVAWTSRYQDGSVVSVYADTFPVPEPGTLAMVVVAVLGLGVFAVWRQKWTGPR